MKTFNHLLIAASLTFNLAAHAEPPAHPVVEVVEGPDFFSTTEHIQAEEAALQAKTPEREGPLAPLLKILNDDWIFVTDGKASVQWASGEIAERGAKAALESLETITKTLNRFETDEALAAHRKLKAASDLVKNGLASSTAHRYNPGLHSAIVNARDLVSQVEIKSLYLAETLYKDGVEAEISFLNSLMEISHRDLKAPTVEGEGPAKKSMDHIYAAARLFKVQVELARDLNRRTDGAFIKKFASDSIRAFLAKTNQQLKVIIAQLKVKKEKMLEVLKALASQKDSQEARELLSQLIGRGTTPKQCRALFRD